jgi:hypothetical protein
MIQGEATAWSWGNTPAAVAKKFVRVRIFLFQIVIDPATAFQRKTAPSLVQTAGGATKTQRDEDPRKGRISLNIAIRTKESS